VKELATLLNREEGSVQSKLTAMGWRKTHLREALWLLLSHYGWELTSMEIENGRMKVAAK
jgi:hypothetical protein